MNDARLESAIDRLRRLPPEASELAVSMIDKLAQAEGVSAITDCSPQKSGTARRRGPHRGDNLGRKRRRIRWRSLATES